MVLLKEMERQHSDAQEQDGAGQVNPGPVNQMKAPRGGGSGETVVYTNEHKDD
ncbi:hypothetical protein [Halospeciosus flavus]